MGRFSLLLLDEGEYLLNEFASVLFLVGAVASDFIVPVGVGGLQSPPTPLHGRVFVCTRGLFFEPDDLRAPIVKLPFRAMAGKPIAVSALGAETATELNALVNAESLSPRNAFACQVTQAIFMKPSGAAEPYRHRHYEDTGAAKAAATAAAAHKEKDEGKKKATGGGFFGKSRIAAGAETDSHSESGSGGGSSGAAAGVFVAGRSTAVIALLHSVLSDVVPLALQLWEIQMMCADAATGRERARIEPIISARREGAFDLSRESFFPPRIVCAPCALTPDRRSQLSPPPQFLAFSGSGRSRRRLRLHHLLSAFSRWSPVLDASR